MTAVLFFWIIKQSKIMFYICQIRVYKVLESQLWKSIPDDTAPNEKSA